ncbi:DUF3304 domain-containing protein [Burkholderia plantarii]|uniref:DUF3304 domain-containing protein n=1 Tax=Burkholderia plantarii TaxID=41899 RepID=UPI000706A3A6|nr:DUF3304 domain-containing protein [Burkholderia plantarii]ALK33837.1 hypothetical protein bpln_2g16170 [Burkholderia plantarii]GLZ19521.1 hypothetical protein Bpla01_30510 [Burkholderia plantarii]
MTTRQADASMSNSELDCTVAYGASRRDKTVRSRFITLRTTALAACSLFILSACASDSLLPDDPLASEHPLWMVPVNPTDNWAINMAVDRYGMGDSNPHDDGAGAACCYPSPKDWSKPVTVHWEWDTVVTPETKIVPPTEPHTMLVHFPPGGPAKNDRYLCLILRDRDTAELAFSRAASRCATK